MKKFSLLLLFSLFFLNLLAQEEKEYYTYKGKIGNIPITMSLTTSFDMQNNVLKYEGSYVYDSQKVPISLYGVFRANGMGGQNPDTEVYIGESYQGKRTGCFVSKDFKSIFSLNVISGTWLNANDKPVYKFQLIKQ